MLIASYSCIRSTVAFKNRKCCDAGTTDCTLLDYYKYFDPDNVAIVNDVVNDLSGYFDFSISTSVSSS